MKPLDQLEKALGFILDNLKSKNKLLKELGTGLSNRAKLNIDEQKDIYGKSFKQSIRASITGGQTLIDKGRLRSSLNSSISESAVKFGTNLKYARTLNEGGKIVAENGDYLTFKVRKDAKFLADKNGKIKVSNRKKDFQWIKKKEVNIPERRFLGIGTGEIEVIKKTLLNYLDAILKK